MVQKTLIYAQTESNFVIIFFFQAEDGIRDLVRSRGLGDVYKRQTVVEHSLDRARRFGLAPCRWFPDRHPALRRAQPGLSLIHI